MKNPCYLIGLPLILVAGTACAQASDAPQAAPGTETPDTTITVLATGAAEPLSQTGQAISVIGAGEIASLQGPDFTTVVERLPGISFDRSGGLGSATGVFVRGANSEQLLVMIDGIKVEDEAAPSGGYDFGGLLSGGIGRVELLRGSNSVVWGSDAIGGVMAITTREMNGAEGSLEYGSHASWDAQAGAGIQRASYGITLNGGYATTDGIPTYIGDTVPNAFGEWHVSARAHLDLAAGLQLVAAGRYVDSKLGIDSYGPAPDYNFGNFGDWQTEKQGSGRVGLAYSAGPLQLNGGIAVSDTRRGYIDPPSGALVPYEATVGRSTRADLTGTVALPAHFTVDFGADTERTSFSDIYYGDGESAHATLTSGHALLGYHAGGIDVSAGGRVDDHSNFGTHWTYGANGSVRLVGDLRMKASYGEGFKAPSLYQLDDPAYGTPTLRPETSRSYDVGLEKGTREGTLHFAATWFERTTSNLIDFVDCYTLALAGCAAQPYGYYANIGRAKARGVEMEGDVRPVPQLVMRGVYTYVKSTDETPGAGTYGDDLARRPRQMLTVSSDWTPDVGSGLDGLALGADLRMVGSSWEDAANTEKLAAYALVSVRASVPVTAHLELYGRIENIGNERYQTELGYNSYGRTATVGVRARL